MFTEKSIQNVWKMGPKSSGKSGLKIGICTLLWTHGLFSVCARLCFRNLCCASGFCRGGRGAVCRKCKQMSKMDHEVNGQATWGGELVHNGAW